MVTQNGKFKACHMHFQAVICQTWHQQSWTSTCLPGSTKAASSWIRVVHGKSERGCSAGDGRKLLECEGFIPHRADAVPLDTGQLRLVLHFYANKWMCGLLTPRQAISLQNHSSDSITNIHVAPWKAVDGTSQRWDQSANACKWQSNQ